MHAYLILTRDTELALKRAREISEKHASTLTPFTLQKLSDVKELSKLTKLTLGKTSFFIENICDATTDSANAFLKQLEEPGENVTYILTADSEAKVLPTIVSRTQVVKLQIVAATSLTNSKIQTTSEESFFSYSIGQQFQKLDKIKKRDEATLFIQGLIESLHAELLTTTHQLVTANRLEEASKTLTALLKNGNVTSQMTRFVVAVNRD